MASARAANRHRALYAACLVLYPRTFRRNYAQPMTELFSDHYRAVGARAWLRAAPDLVHTVPKERIEAVMAGLSTGSRALALAFVVLGACVVAIGFGGGAVPVVAVAVVAVLFTQRRLLASFPHGERAPLRSALVQEWWAPVAGLLGLITLVGGMVTVFEAHNWGGRIIGSGLLLAFGCTMLFGLMRRPFDRVAGNSMVLLATVPPLIFFWFIVPPVAALLVWFGVLRSGFSERPVVPTAS